MSKGGLDLIHKGRGHAWRDFKILEGSGEILVALPDLCATSLPDGGPDLFQRLMHFDQPGLTRRVSGTTFLHGTQMRPLHFRFDRCGQTINQPFRQLLGLGRWQSQRIIKHLPGIRSHI